MSKISDTTNKIAELKKDIAELELSLNDELKQSFQNFDVTMLMCNKDNIDVVLIEDDNNRFVPKIYN